MKTVLFCGDKAPYGFAHIQALLQSQFNLIGVVLPTLQMRHAVLEKFTGKKIGSYNRGKKRIKEIIKKCISKSLVSRIPNVYSKTINAEVILKKHKVPYWYVDDANSEELVNELKKMEPDLILCAGFPQILSRELLTIPKNGAVNFHPSLLPKFRGPSPFFWIIATGAEESAITAHFMTKEIDGGDIIARIKFSIPDYTCAELERKCIRETSNLIKQVHTFFSEGKQAPQIQDNSESSYFRYERENDCRLLWKQQTPRQIYNLTRTGKAFCFFGNRKLGITKCSISEKGSDFVIDVHAEEGTVVKASKDSLVIRATDGYIDVREIVYRGRAMTPQKFTKQLNIREGAKFS